MNTINGYFLLHDLKHALDFGYLSYFDSKQVHTHTNPHTNKYEVED